jgi:hypothetical protein
MRLVVSKPPFAGYPSTGKRAVLIVRDNRFTLNPPDVWGVWLEGVDDALILNNKFSGNSAAAVEAGFWGRPTRRGIIAGNDLSKYTLSNGSPYKIVLEVGTEYYIVTGVPAENVNDLGTNNLIGGKKTQIRDFLSQALRTEHGQKMDWIKRMMRGFHVLDH